MDTHWVMDIADIFAIGVLMGIRTQAGMTVIGQRQVRDHPSGGKLRDSTFAIGLSLQMTTN